MISVEEHDGVAVVRIDHGPVNALDLELLKAITATMSRVVDAPATVLTGARTAFSTGVDLRRLVSAEARAAAADYLDRLGRGRRPRAD